ncbi:MAG: peptidylprolyl isomerase [Myxococcales bacterium]|nr:peptidylprolyl isomerase [Myxococcales bacterium]MCB9646532.1 peptidylprolyl isomerase [Deltaproteobacteria bacterium]
MSTLTDPSALPAPAPETFTVLLETTRGALHVDVERALAPLGADRFYGLVQAGYYDDVAFFRVVPGFVAQVGIHGDPAVNKIWRKAPFRDDPVRAENLPGTVTFATSGKDARTTQFFINLRDNRRLDAMGFAPFGRVRELEVAEALYSGYGESPPGGKGPMQGELHRQGNAYLRAGWPELDYIVRARVVA